MPNHIDAWARVIGGSRLAAVDDLRRQDLQEANRRRKAGNNGMTDAATIITQAPMKAARIYSDMKSKIASIQNDHLVPENGKFIETARLKEAAASELRKLSEKVETATHVQKARLAIKRDNLRPKVPEAQRARVEGYYTRLADSGVPLERLIALADGDAVALRCLEDLAPVLAMAQRPQDPNAADGFSEAVQNAALAAYSDEYKAAHDAVVAAEDTSYYAPMAVTEATTSLQNGVEPVIADTQRKIIYSGNNDAAA